MDLYIYYRAAAANAALVEAEAAAMQAALRRSHGVLALLKRRPAIENETHTWMEVYLHVPTDFGAALDAALANSRLPSLIQGARHTEQFMDIPTCA